MIPIIQTRLYMIGLTKQTSNPTLLFNSAYKAPHRRVMQLLWSSKLLDDYPPGIKMAESTQPPLKKPLPLIYSLDSHVIATNGGGTWIGSAVCGITVVAAPYVFESALVIAGSDGALNEFSFEEDLEMDNFEDLMDHIDVEMSMDSASPSFV
ncbi:hypothetical protein B0O99DRAFT_713319 [Bisporella sp. PMI_857]|nr:hypothetical protein B0O99DRAFT_713319 [Bisporella sp. PMI_857]